MTRTLFFGLILLTGCTASKPASSGDGGATSNVVDAVVVPMLTANGLTVVPEDNGILCRRLAIDLTGLAPTPQERADHCTGPGATAQNMAAYFLNKPAGANVPDGSPPYVWVNRRWWADSFEYQSGTNPASTYYTYVRELDQLVSDLYAGKIPYDVFAAKALSSPAFARRFGVFEANHDLVQIASQAYRVFLGREALPSEAEDFGNLWGAWTSKFMDEPTSETAYPDCPVTFDQQLNRIGCRHYELGLLGSQCAGVNQVSCQSTTLGDAQVVPAVATFVRWADLTDADHAQLEQAGKLMAAQPGFAEAAVDRALLKYLGWWKAGFYRPDFDLPAVRDALAQKFRADAYDLRKLETEIVTSVLYTQAAARRPDQLATVPIWAFGPSKLVYAEAWLDSVGQALGKSVGGCDFRFTGSGANKIAGFYVFKTAGVGANFYAPNAQNMGGCPVASTHGDASGLVPAVTRRVVLSQLCPNALKPAAGATVATLIAQAFDGVGRAPSDAESQILTKYMVLPTDGKLQPLADGLCTSLFATTSFNYY